MTDKINKKEIEISKLEAKFNQLSKLVSEEFLALINQYLNDGNFEPLKQYRIRNYPDSYYLKGNDYDLYSVANDLYRARNTLQKYLNQLHKLDAINHLPEVLIKFKDNLIKKWDEFDIYKRNKIREEYKNQPSGINQEYREWQYHMREIYGTNWYQFKFLTDEQIHNNNVKDGNNLVLDLINRTNKYIGQITDCSLLYLDSNNSGYLIINGIIKGINGNVRVESIGAGGYNIQRYHIRVLVKPIK